jgi:site-specific recombinase XerD
MSQNQIMSIIEMIDKYLEYLEIEKNSSKLTIRNYRHYLNRFADYLKNLPNSVTDPSKISTDIIRSYRLFLARFYDENKLPLKKITQNYHLIAVRSFLRYMIRNDIRTLAAEKVELGRAESRSILFLSRDQIDRLLSSPSISDEKGLRDKAILETLFSTGLRVSELVSLNRDSINFERGEFGVRGKGGKIRVVFLSEQAVNWIKRYLDTRKDEYKPLFIRYAGKKADPQHPDKSYRLTVRSVQRIVEKYTKKAKLPVRITPHGLRHSFATDLLSAGADIRSIQEMLGHKNISTTQIYTHVTNPQLRDIHHKFHHK